MFLLSIVFFTSDCATAFLLSSLFFLSKAEHRVKCVCGFFLVFGSGYWVTSLFFHIYQVPDVYYMYRSAFRCVCTHRSGPRVRDGTHVSPPSLRRLTVFLIRAVEHALHGSGVVLAHGRDVHVAPESGTSPLHSAALVSLRWLVSYQSRMFLIHEIAFNEHHGFMLSRRLPMGPDRRLESRRTREKPTGNKTISRAQERTKDGEMFKRKE